MGRRKGQYHCVELALKMRIDPETFMETIERHNKVCETGKDLDFGKPAQSLKPTKTLPFDSIFGHRACAS
jgi:fumarate reductase flavoprotein subunit